MTTIPLVQDVDLAPYTDSTYQVWVWSENGGRFVYRENLIYSVAQNYAKAWNEQPPSDVPNGAAFIAVQATTTFEVI